MMTSNTVMMRMMCVLLLLYLLLAKDVVECDPEIQVFTCEKWDARDKSWTTDASFEEGQKGRMRCVVSGNKDECQKCSISKTDREPLSRSEDSFTYLYEFDNINCNMTGIYQCTCKNDTIKSEVTELGVSACAPHFCNDGGELETSEDDAVHKTKTISLCIVAYEGIMKTAHLNGAPVIANKSPEDKKWRWWYENGQFSKYTVHIQIRNVSKEDYGEHNFTIFSNEGEQYKMDYNIVLKKQGLPECPKQVNVTEIGTSHVSLTWTPVSTVNAKQTFHVLRSKDTENWKLVLRVEEARATIHNLNESTDYFFRVVSSNIYGEAVGCEEWKYIITGSASSGGESVVENLSVIFIMATAGLWLSSLKLMFGFDVKQCFETKEMQMSRLNVSLTGCAESAFQKSNPSSSSWEVETKNCLANGALAKESMDSARGTE